MVVHRVDHLNDESQKVQFRPTGRSKQGRQAEADRLPVSPLQVEACSGLTVQ